MTLQQLIYVVTVADETSMNRAAQRLYLAQSSLSAGIHSLEEELGFSLFRRSNRGVVPTPEGEEFLAYARQIVKNAAVLAAQILAVSDEVFLAAYAIVANIAYVLKGLFGAFGQAAQPIISHNYGAGDMRRVKQTLRIALISSLLFALALYALCLFFPTQLAAFFANHDRAVIALGAAGIVLYFSSLPFSALNTVIMYYFQSIEQGRCATLLALLKGTLFAFIGMALLYALFQENGIWLTITFAEGCALILAWIMQRRIDRS